ncbi:MAG TPA: IS110 family transposase [Thermoanaerobaculia bacterium]|nr:IS110 family transposase [Thermoanaerobaculia bacterium]
MEVVHSRCAGLDVHKETVVACVRVIEGRQVQQEVRTFHTITKELLRLSDWLTESGCTHVAMESTGVYWKPVWHVLEGSFELVLANAGAIRNVPGRKTDVNDSMWIADLLAHGLIRGSFVPPTPVQELRDLTRTRAQLVREIARHSQRIQKTMEDANLKLAGLITDILGVTGRAILEALIGGETDLEALASLRRGSIKASREELVEALRGSVRDHHRFLLRLHLRQIDAAKQAVGDLEARMEDLLRPFRRSVELLTTIPGVSETTARVVLAEIGFDMARFPSAGHLVSWAGLCPRNDESAGKRRSTRLRPGNTWLKSTLVQAAWAATRKKDSGLRAQYLRLKSRRGPKKAVVAVAASMLTSAYYMLQRDVPYQDLGPSYLDALNPQRTANRLTRRLRDLGFEVEIRRAA